MADGTLLVIRPDGTTDRILNEYEAIKRGLDDKWMDFLRCSDDVGFYILDEGMLDGSPLNVPASILASRPIYGPAVLTGGRPDPEGADVPPDDDIMRLGTTFGRSWRSVIAGAEAVGQDVTMVANPATIPAPQIVGFDEIGALEKFIRDGQTRG